MQVNIQDLVNKLIANTQFNSEISALEANDWVYSMSTTVHKLQQNQTDPDLQKKLITTFIGGTILALCRNDSKYAGGGYNANFSPCLYPFILPGFDALAKIYNRQYSELDNSMDNDKEAKKEKLVAKHIQDIGELALKHLPNSFCGALFKISASIRGPQKSEQFFPKLATMADDVDTLVAFCQQHPGNLNQAEADIDQVTHYATAEDYLAAHLDKFAQNHQKDFNSGLFGGFFSRTKIDYNNLNARELLNHAKKTTFFGFHNRTHNVLEKMGVLDKNNIELFHDEQANESTTSDYGYGNNNYS